MDLVLGIDVGTGSTKGVLADTCGQVFVTAARSYQYDSPAPGAAEQDPEQWWAAVCMVIRELLSARDDAASSVRAIAISGQGVAAVLLDGDGKPVRPAMLWMDTRCATEAERLNERHGAQFAQISGKRPAAYNVEPKLHWVREHEPETWKRVARVTTTTGFITYRLTGRQVMNHSDAGILLAYDLGKRRWSPTLLSALELGENLYCDLAECAEIIGAVTASAAQDTGLLPGTPIVAGGEDTSSAGLGMGVLHAGDVQLSMGNASTMYMPLREPHLDDRLLAFPHVVSGYTLLGGSMVSGGIAMEWIAKLLGRSPWNASVNLAALSDLMREASEVPPGGHGLLFVPYLAGELQPVNDGFARGMLVGLSLETRPAEVLRALIEGTAFCIRHNLETARECGARPERIVAVGGPSRNDLWCQTIADATHLPLDAMADSAGAPLGDAILAALGAGLIEDPRSMQRAHAKQRAQFKPSPHAVASLDRMYTMHRELYPRLRDLFPQLLLSRKATL